MRGRAVAGARVGTAASGVAGGSVTFDGDAVGVVLAVGFGVVAADGLDEFPNRKKLPTAMATTAAADPPIVARCRILRARSMRRCCCRSKRSRASLRWRSLLPATSAAFLVVFCHSA